MLVVLGAWWAGGRWWAGYFSSRGHCSVPSLSRHKVSTGTELQSHKPHATLRPLLNHILYLWKDHSKDFHKLSSLQTHFVLRHSIKKSEALWVPDLKVCCSFVLDGWRFWFIRCFWKKSLILKAAFIWWNSANICLINLMHLCHVIIWLFLCLQQNNLPHTQPYTGPAAQHVNNPQCPGPRAQENWEPPEEVPPSQTKD